MQLADAAALCTVNGQCPSQHCSGSAQTTISGTVYDPAGVNPLPFVAVYVPQTTPLDPLPQGASCEDCQTLYTNTVLAGSLTKADGTFQIVNPPVGQGVPLVVQAGKWRKMYTLAVTECQDNQYAAGKLKLPTSGTDGPGASLPQLAISTGGADSLECLLERIGVAASEYTSGPGGSGHLHVFQGGTTGNGLPGPTIPGGSPASSRSLWDSTADLLNYDIVLLSCEGAETASPNPTALDAYAKMGGRVFASHFHYAWFTVNGSPFFGYGLANWMAGTNDTGDINAVVDTTLPNNTVFPKGQAMRDWLKLVGALSATGELPITASRNNVASVNYPPSTPWISAAPDVATTMGAVPGMVQYFSFDEPLGSNVEKVCGRVVYSDLHVGAASGDYGGATTTSGGMVPMGCKPNATLSPQEAALEFMLFDLSSCLTPVGNMPTGPSTAM